ncbi:MAG: adenosine kinase [Nitrospinota bacterium]|nr:adenosine kinase [Nitrospinota bacterium]
MNYDLIGIGNALVDIEVKVEDHFIERHALTKGGMTLSTEEDQKKILSALSDQATKIVSGGSAANTVHGLSVLGGSAFYLGRVANDLYGRHYTEDMNRCGVGFFGPGVESSGTGTCVILVTPDTERTMLTHLGVSSALHPDNVDPTIVKNSRMVYIEGYLWTGDETRTAAKRLADIAKNERIPVSFTLSDAFVVNTFKESLVDFIRWNVDILFCNEVEAKAMAGTEDPEAAFDQLKNMADTVFMTLGKNGSWAVNSSQPRTHVHAFPVQAVDTTGAGDLYAAGALYGVVKNHSLEESAVIGSYCASQVVTQMGGRMPVHSHAEVEKILRQYEVIRSDQR